MSNEGTVQHLNTKKFRETTMIFKDGIKEYIDIKSQVEIYSKNAIAEWAGEGKIQFEKDYVMIYRQLIDIEEIMYELYDALVDAEAAYILADEETAKALTM